MRNKLVYTNVLAGYRIELYHTGKDRYKVIYGEQVQQGLSYVTAAQELGLSIMHALQCEGKLDSYQGGKS